MRVLILCAGQAERWGNYLGAPKHFAPINGEPILNRTVRQILELQPQADIRIILRPDETDDRYKIPGTKIENATLHPELRDADKFLSSADLWSQTSRTVLMYGDCYFTTAAIVQILSERTLPDGWAVYARFGESTITGTPWGENLAHVIDPEIHDKWYSTLRSLPDRTTNWQGGRCGGHEQYMAMEFGDPCQYQRQGPHGVHIDDWSDDFDYPADWDRWCINFARATPEQKVRSL